MLLRITYEEPCQNRVKFLVDNADKLALRIIFNPRPRFRGIRRGLTPQPLFAGSKMDRLTDKAIKQIEKKNYGERFLNESRPLIYLGVGFADKEIGYKKVNCLNESSGFCYKHR